MKVFIDRLENGTFFRAKETKRNAVIRRVITRCREDGYSLALLDDDSYQGYCHVPAFRVKEDTVERLEKAASQWVVAGVIVPACLEQHLG
jgi:hypothetical protein